MPDQTKLSGCHRRAQEMDFISSYDSAGATNLAEDRRLNTNVRIKAQPGLARPNVAEK
jgi:hypothetical protein